MGVERWRQQGDGDVTTRRRVCAVLVVVLSLSGCWLQPGYGPERQNFNPFETGLTEANVDDLALAWSRPREAPPVVEQQPLATGSTVFAASPRDVGGQRLLTVDAVDMASGEARWRRDLPMPSFGGAGEILSVADGQVLVLLGAFANAQFTVLDADTGTTVATATAAATDSVSGGRWAVAGHDVVAHLAHTSTPGVGLTTRLVVRDRSTLDVLWETATLGSFPTLDSILIAGERILVGGQASILSFEVDGCGAAVCSATSTTPIPPLPAGAMPGDVVVLAASDDGTVFLRRPWSTDTPTLWGIDLVAVPIDGGAGWSTKFDSTASFVEGIAVAGDTVFVIGDDAVATDQNSLLALDAASGAVRWRADVPSLHDRPVVAGGLVYAEQTTTGNADVAVFDAGGCGAPDCTELLTLDTGPGTGGIYSLSVSAGTLLVDKAGPGAELQAYRPSP